MNKIYFIKKDNKLKIKNVIENKNENNNYVISDGRGKGDEKEHFINVNRNIKNNVGKRNENNSFKDEKSSLKMSVALNEIIINNNKREEKKRKFLKKNKTILLNSFFNMTYKGRSNKINDIVHNSTKNVKKKDDCKKTEINIQEKANNRIENKFPIFQKRKIEISYVPNLIKKRFNTENIETKKVYKNNILKNKEIKSISNQNSEKRNLNYSNINNSNNLNLNINNNRTFIKDYRKSKTRSGTIITKIEYKLRSKIPHLRQKIIEKKRNNNNNYYNNDIDNRIFKNKDSNKKYLTKIVNIPHKKNYSFTKDKIFINDRDNINLHSMKQIKTINEALALIRIDRINSKKKVKTNSKNSKNKNSNSSSFTGATRSNSKSSRSKENKIVLNKANSSSLNYRNELTFNLIDDNSINISNKKQTILALKENLIYSKSYIKHDVLEKIVKTFNSDNSFFIIFCEKYVKVDNDKSNENLKNRRNNFILLFKSLMKYYHNQNRFIKIYGDESAPNVLSIKNININKYFIYKKTNIQKEVNIRIKMILH